MKPSKELSAIWRHCLMCCGGTKRLVDECGITSCALHPYRNSRAASADEAREKETSIPGQMTMFDAKGA